MRCTTWATPSARPSHVRDSLKPDGTLMLVEPKAGDSLADNLNPGRTRLLRLLDQRVRANVAESGGWRGAGRAGRREAADGGCASGRIFARPASSRDAVQHGARSAALRRMAASGVLAAPLDVVLGLFGRASVARRWLRYSNENRAADQHARGADQARHDHADGESGRIAAAPATIMTIRETGPISRWK